MENTELNNKTGKYHNKFYRMIELDNGKFLAEWGSIGKNPLGTKEYSMNEWHDIQGKKQTKGYVFATDPGNSTLNVPTLDPLYDPEKVEDIRGRIEKVMKTIDQPVILELAEDQKKDLDRTNDIFIEFDNDPGTFTSKIAEELNEIYNKYRMDKN
jgi:hypothetical protein